MYKIGIRNFLNLIRWILRFVHNQKFRLLVHIIHTNTINGYLTNLLFTNTPYYTNTLETWVQVKMLMIS